MAVDGKVRLPYSSLSTILHPIRNREGGSNETRTSRGGTRGATTGTGAGGAQAGKKKRDSCEQGGGRLLRGSPLLLALALALSGLKRRLGISVYPSCPGRPHQDRKHSKGVADSAAC